MSRPLSAVAPPPGATWFDKDVLRVGTWRVRTESWPVTRATLHRLARNWKLADARGISVPVVWNHSTDVRDQLGFVTRLYVVGPVLRARFWTADARATRYLGITAREVSVEVRRDWRDGQGHVYDLMVTHVGVVGLPVVPHQGPFLRVRPPPARAGPRRSRPRSLGLPRSDLRHTTGRTAMTLTTDLPQETDARSELVHEINVLLTLLGITELLPADVPLGELAERLRRLLDELPSEPDGQDAASEVKRLRLQVEQLTDELRTERVRQQAQQRAAFASRLDRLIADGKLEPAERRSLLSLAEPAGYSLSLLAPLERIPAGAALPTHGLARRTATVLPPAEPGVTPMTEERARAIAEHFAR